MPTYHNRILAALPPDELTRIEPFLERVQLTHRQLIYDPNVPIEHVHLPETGVISVLSVMADGTAIETVTVGSDGFVGLAVFHGVDIATEQAFVQVTGEGYRIRSAAFRELLNDCPSFTGLLHRYAAFLFSFASQCSGCNRLHNIEQRCARWLLMVHDRVPGDEFDLTQEFLSQMLGVRRATVSEVASGLQAAGLISYSRGHITVVNRAGLEGKSCECYEILTSNFERLMLGQSRTPNPLAEVKTSEGGRSTLGDSVSPEAVAVDEVR